MENSIIKNGCSVRTDIRVLWAKCLGEQRFHPVEQQSKLSDFFAENFLENIISQRVMPTALDFILLSYVKIACLRVLTIIRTTITLILNMQGIMTRYLGSRIRSTNKSIGGYMK